MAAPLRWRFCSAGPREGAVLPSLSGNRPRVSSRSDASTGATPSRLSPSTCYGTLPSSWRHSRC
ncbi:unnamed protein product [Linum tenue]|uniref:Uncharacterized protein n=1 Tax=Linum tenue TaxID=586396 RepID=A0AAV0LG55_9ROSI|nr:unnamed protein product [Linum tenue]